jgi:hypothetical protein
LVSNRTLLLTISIFAILIFATFVVSHTFRLAILIVSIGIFLIALVFGPPSGHEIFQSRYVLALFLAGGSILLVTKSGSKFLMRVNLRKDVILVPIASIMALILQLQILIPFNGYLGAFQKAANSCSGVRPFNTTELSQLEDQFVWDYTSPVLSRIFWTNKEGCLIENRDPNVWQPFIPSDTDPYQRNLYWK